MTGPPLWLILVLLGAGVYGLWIGMRMQYPKGASVVDVWQRGWKLAALIGGLGATIAGAVNLLRWVSSR